MKKSRSNQLLSAGFQLRSVIRGLVWALAVTILLGLIISLLLQFTSLTEGLLGSYSTFIFFLSMLFGATIGARTAGNKGLLHGLSITLLYWIITVIIGVIWNSESLTLLFIAKRFGLCLLAGVLGGIIGIGLSK